MPTISSDLIPSIAPGSIFDNFVNDSNLNIRWLTARDPAFYEAINRPIADVAVRQLIISKTIDAIQLRLSHQNVYPFIIPAKVNTGTTEVFLPSSWIWDLHVSVTKKWEYLRLAKIQRLSGQNNSTDSDLPTGRLRLIFSGEQQNSNVEVSLFYVDYVIDTTLEYQYARIIPVDSTIGETNYVEEAEAETITGFITFRYLDPADKVDGEFIDSLQPPVSGTDVNSDGFYDTPASYEIVDSEAGGTNVEDDFSLLSVSHGTGLLTPSSFNLIPPLDSDINSWLIAFNYPFRVNASLTSASPINITLPKPLFNEFNLTVPASDEPSNMSLTPDSSGLFSPVWISKIRRCDDTANTLQFFFSTYNIKFEQESTDPVEFALLELNRNYSSGQVVEISQLDPFNIVLEDGSEKNLFDQDFGRGHVVLSNLWGDDTDVIDNFFDSFQVLLDDPADVTFNKSDTLIGNIGALSRVPKFIPNFGQYLALNGTTSDRNSPIYPSNDNKFVTEQDQGLGDEVNFSNVDGISENIDIEPIAYSGSLAHKSFVLIVDSKGEDHNYNDDILPRIRHLLGRDPVPFDVWFDGTRIKTFTPNGTWIG